MADSSGELKVISFRPGIDKNNTSYENEGTFIDGDKVRFRNGKPEKMTGWSNAQLQDYQNNSKSTLTGVARSVKSFIDLNQSKYIAFGTHKKVQNVLSGQIYDITPLVTVATKTGVIATSINSTRVGISYPSHDQQVGNSVIFANQGVSVGNVKLSGEYLVKDVSNVNMFYVSVATSANLTSVSGGGNLQVSFLYPVGEIDNGLAGGYGAGTWSESTYSTPRTAGTILTKLRMWSIDTWGEDLLMVPKEGGLYHWDATNGVVPSTVNGSDVRATLVTAAPGKNSMVFVTPERHAVLLGTNDTLTSVYDPLLIRWSSQEDYTDWFPTSVNSAGDYRATGGSQLVGYAKSKLETIIFTDETVFSMSYKGDPYFYGFDILANNAGLISQNAAAEVDGVVYWMGDSAFYKYSGVVDRLQCTLADFIFKQDPVGAINRTQKEKIFAGVNKTYNEIIWFYPSGTNSENSRYIIYNYKEDTWYDGTMVRTVWEPNNIFELPYATFVSVSGTDSEVYVHDNTLNDDGMPMDSYVETGYFDISDGDQTMFLSLFIPDFRITGSLTMYLEARKAPFGTVTEKGPYTIRNENAKAKLPIRVRGREISLKFESNELNSNYRLGKIRINPLPDGRR